MKFSLLILLAAAPLLQAATVDATSEISAVTVYADRARITRAASAAMPAGESIVRFRGLPADLDDSSLQAGGSGANMKILGVEIRRVFSEEVVNERVRALEAQLEALSDMEKDIAAQTVDNQEQRKFLQKVRDGLVLSGNSDGKTPPQGLEKIKPLYDFYSAELSALSKDALALEVASRELQPKRKLLVEELNRLQGSRGKNEKEVLVAVQAGAATSAQFTLSYNMRNASWAPLYDARVNTRTGQIDLAYDGVVRQQTGENWQNVKLSLSTARPNVGARMPEIQPWWVRFAEIVVPSSETKSDDLMRNNRLLGLQANQEMSKSADKVAAAPEPMAFQEATIDNAGVSTVFEIKIPSSIPSDGERHQVAILTQKLEGTLEYVATPKLSQQVYLRTRLTNTSGAPILGGEVNLFRDGDFVGQSRVNFIADGAGFDFYLGVDDGVKVTHKMLTDKSAEGGMIQKRKDITRKYEITVENFKAQPVKVVIFDQLPVSQDAAIVLSNVKFSDTPKQEKDTGKLTWEFSLDPKAKKVLTEEFRVEWPADRQIGGL